ncbi:fimbrial assembly protein PilN [Jatrophihabitans sp. GAS493]|uniref:PilN domain-containing protein n=1 Tax=Jatrophihabitans sp. GAS493 TaxID=1907575 RepID=UPI000BB6D99F|nr:PilN domain-containing protein [Jatrophihabitans sp. GAS493]SOD74777.1 fimbrial assembly protein PilN [Jatrophihabitans sp. GAS493]
MSMLTRQAPDSGPAQLPVPGPMTMINVCADLLPREIVEARQGKKAKKMAIMALAGLLVVIIGWDVIARIQTSSAQSDIDAANAQTTALTLKQHSYGELSQVQSQSKQITASLNSLLSGDLQWGDLIAAVRHSVPQGLSIQTLSGSLDASSTKTTTAGGTALLNTSGLAEVGTLTVTGMASSPNTVAAFVDAVSKVPGVTAPVPSSILQADGGIAFSAAFVLTTKLLTGGRFSSSAASGSTSGAGK